MTTRNINLADADPLLQRWFHCPIRYSEERAKQVPDDMKQEIQQRLEEAKKETDVLELIPD